MRGIISDLSLVLRQFRRSPGFAIFSVLMLAFGVGATTAIFSVVDGILLRPLPLPHPEELVTLGDQVTTTNWGQTDPGPVTGPEVQIYPRDTRAFTSLGGFGFSGFELAGVGEPAQISAARMTPSMFTTLGVAPLMGRVFTPQEDEQKQLVAVLSYQTWKSRFHGAPNVLGSKILLDRKPYLIIGVMPRDFRFPLPQGHLDSTELWVPMSLEPRELTAEANASWYLNLVGRLKPGVTREQAEADANRVAREIMAAFPPDARNLHIHSVVYPLQAITVLQARPLLRILFLAVTVVLLIACANLAGLLLVRAIQRQRETAVRLATGAPAWTLLRQMMVESLALSGAGGVLGIGLAALALKFGTTLLPETMPLESSISLNWSVVAFALFLALLTGFLCGLAPGFAALRTNVNAALKEGGRSGSAGGSHARLRSGLVIMEIAVALVLLAASGLLLRSFSAMSRVDLGFRPDHVTTTYYSLPQKEYSTQATIDTFNRKLLDQLRQLPGAEAVGLTGTLPTGGSGIGAFVVEGYVDPRGAAESTGSQSQVIGDYFKAMGISLLRGRYFTEADDANAQLVVIVNREFAQHYWPNQDPIGKRLRVGLQKTVTPWLTVVGEVANAKLRAPDDDAAEQFYQPVAQQEKSAGALAQPTDLNGNDNFIVLRSALPPEQMENGIRSVVRSIDPQLPLKQIQTMDQVVSQSEAPRRFNTLVISAFALAAVLLAALGIYSIIAFSVASRRQEMAIRITLGSSRAEILCLVLISAAKLVAVGAIIGLAGAAAASSLVRGFLFQVSPFDPIVMVLSAIAVFALSLIAAAMPARRASVVDPIETLRGE